MLLLFSLSTLLFLNVYGLIPYCQPWNSTCWPTSNEINAFSNELDGTLIIKNMSNDEYINITKHVSNPWTISYPSFIILIKSHFDVSNCVKFASLHNIQISIQSTGHSYSGRNSANNSLQINLGLMQSYYINANRTDPWITVESGLRWGQIYSLINKIMPDYIVVGGGDQSVGPAGYSSLGGHSPLTPRYGLSIDYIKDFFIVAANTDIIHVYHTNGKNKSIDNLFWSLKGGGASTFGVILNITFQLVKDTNNNNNNNDIYNVLQCLYPLYSKPFLKKEYIGYSVLYDYFDYIQNGLDSSITGAWEIIYAAPYNSYDFAFFFIYYGNSSYAKQIFQPLQILNPYNMNETAYCQITQYFHFWDFWSFIPPDYGGISPLYIFNDFIPQKNLTKKYADTLLTLLNETDLVKNEYGFYVSTATLIGGYNNLNNFPYGINNSVGLGFRNSYIAHSINIFWNETAINCSVNDVIKYSKKWETTFKDFRIGIYSNEENYECDGCDWKQEFWGNTNYNKLLSVKQQIDPNQVFWCNHCVGSDQ